MTRLKVGNIEVARVVESNGPFMSIYDFFPDATDEKLAPHRIWLEPNAICPKTNMLIMPIQSYVLKTDKFTILVDSCVGNHKTVKWYPAWHQKTDNSFLSNLSNHSIHPDEIDIVLCTHLHVDHSGWNTQLSNGRWVPTFKNARYILSKKECENAAHLSEKYGDPTYNENVLPIIEAGQALLVADDYQIDDSVWLEPTPGHTPGHCSIRLSHRDENAVITGDLIHSPVQCQFPHWNFKFDTDKELAAETRLNFLKNYSDCDVKVLTSHFPQPSTGRIELNGDAFKFKYDE